MVGRRINYDTVKSQPSSFLTNVKLYERLGLTQVQLLCQTVSSSSYKSIERKKSYLQREERIKL